ncbi:uncharacterized protein LOC143193769 [Rhynchophorus ferrugineus]|uniref:uncharacterized protein LOC143193769 n=1 Tax=Rhynchophorus ferrugineus TaxID=354439 RepID=UPI003FCDD1E9
MNRLSDDPWFGYNVLSLVCDYLNVADILNVSKVCRLWRDVIRDKLKFETPIFSCCKHLEDIGEQYGDVICKLCVIDTHHLSFKVKTSTLLNCSHRIQVVCKTTQYFAGLYRSQCPFPITNVIVTAFVNITKLCIYSDSPIPLQFPSRFTNPDNLFYWCSLRKLKQLKSLELNFYIVNNFGFEVLVHLHELEVLILHCYSGDDESLFHNLSFLPKLRHLTVLKTYCNKDLQTYLPKMHQLEQLELFLKAPGDWNFKQLLVCVKSMDKGALRKFTWIVREVCLIETFFGDNCQELLNMEHEVTLASIRTALKQFFLQVSVDICIESDYFDRRKKYFKTCVKCDSNFSEF